MKKNNFLTKSLLYFKKWSSKPYGIFQSLNKPVKICTLSVFYLFIWSSPINAQKDTIRLDEIMISAQRAPVLFSESGRAMGVIKNDDIRIFAAQSLQEALENYPAIDIRQRGAGEVQSDLSIRGGSFDQVLIMINGLKMNDPQTGHHSLDLPLDLLNINRIEVLYGPGARMYGNNSLSGAINIITTDLKKSKVQAAFSGGEQGYLSGTILGTFNSNGYKNNLSFAKKTSNDYIENTDFNITNVFYHSEIPTNIGVFQVMGGYSDKEFGANSFYSSVYPYQYEKTQTYFANVSLKIGDEYTIQPHVFWRRHQDEFHLFRETDGYYQKYGNYYIMDNDTAKYRPNNYSPSNYYTGHNYHLTDVYGAEINTIIPLDFGKTSFGLEYRSENILSNKLGEKTDSIKVPFADDKWFTRSKSRESFSAFVEQLIIYKQWSLSAGGLLLWNSDFGTHIYPGIDLGFSVNPKLKIFASYNQSNRFPTFTDLYYTDSYSVGNPDLKPEKAETFEIGTKAKYWALSYNASAFFRKSNNTIDWIRTADTLKWISQNLTNLITYGADCNISFDLTKLIKPKFFIKSIQLGYAHIQMDKNADDYNSKYALDYLNDKFTANISHRIYKKINANWQVIYQKRAGTYTSNGFEIDYKTVWLFNSKISWRNKWLEIYFETSNITNIKYFDFGNIQMPGRWIKAGLQLDLNI